MSDKFNVDELLDFDKYSQYSSDKEFDLDEILGITTPKSESQVDFSRTSVDMMGENAKNPNKKADITPAVEEGPATSCVAPIQEELSAPAEVPEIQDNTGTESEIDSVNASVVPEVDRKDEDFVFQSNPVAEPIVEIYTEEKTDKIESNPFVAPEILFDSQEEESEISKIGVKIDDFLFAEESTLEDDVIVSSVDEAPVPFVAEPVTMIPEPEEKILTHAKTETAEKPESFTFNVAAFDKIKAQCDERSGRIIENTATDYPIPTLFEEEQVRTEEENIEDEAVAKDSEKVAAAVQQELPSQKKQQVIEEYSSPEEQEDIKIGLKGLIFKVTTKCVAVSVLFLASVFLLLCLFGTFSFMVPSAISPLENTSWYFLVCIALNLLYILLNISPLFDGFKKIFLGRITSDGAALVLGFCATLYDLYFFINPEKFKDVMITFDIVFALTILFNLFGKRLLVKHIFENFALLCQDENKTVIGRPRSSAIDNDVMVETGRGGDILYAARTNKVDDYLNKAFAQEKLNQKVEVFSLIVYIGIALFGLTSWLCRLLPLQNTVVLVLALMSVSSPIFTVWTHMLYIFKLGSFLREKGTMISGVEGAKELSDSGVLVVCDTDLLNCDDIALCGMQIVGGYDPIEVIQKSAALFHKVGGPLCGFFDKILDHSPDHLPSIFETYYYERLGYTCVMDDCRVAVGNEDFMNQLRVELPKIECRDEDRVICVAIDNVLAGAFCVHYRIPKNTLNALKTLEDEGIALAVVSNDFNLDEAMFDAIIEDGELITILSEETSVQCRSCCQSMTSASMEIMTYDRLAGMSYGLAGCSSLLMACVKHNIYRITSVLFGIAAVSIVWFFGNQPFSILALQIMLYQFLWNVPNLFRALRVKF